MSASYMDQIEFPLERSYNRRIVPVCSTYRFVRDGLLERIGKRYVIYGNWDKLFGCWDVDKSCSPSTTTEILPYWPVIFSIHEYSNASQASVLRNLQWAEESELVIGKRADYNFATYLQNIPTLIQKLVLPYGWKQWLALDLCHQVPGFWRFLHSERNTSNTGYVGACLAALYAKQDHSRGTRRAHGKNMAYSKRRDVLSELMRRDLTKSDVRVIQKLAPSIKWSDVEATLEAISNLESNAVLRHAEQISAELLDAMNWLPTEFIHPNLSSLVSDDTSVDFLDHTIFHVTQNLTPEQVKQAGKSFGKLLSDADIKEWADRWDETGKKNVSFPAPPFIVDAPLTPIKSYSELQSEGRLMRNCVANYFQNIVDRELYFFHWDGDEPASVCFMSTPAGGWRFEEALGVGNTELSAKTLKEILGQITL